MRSNIQMRLRGFGAAPTCIPGCDRRVSGASGRTSVARSFRGSTTRLSALRACAPIRLEPLGLARRWTSGLPLALVLASLGLAIATAHAEPGTDAGLVWQAPVSCPSLDEVRARIERRLGSSIDRAVHGVEVAVARDGEGGGRFVARIDLRAVTVANEIRVLTSARCDELADAVAVVIARVAAEHQVA